MRPRNPYTGRFRAPSARSGSAEQKRLVHSAGELYRTRDDQPVLAADAKAKRERPFKLSPPSDGGEAPVLRAVGQLLHHHPRIGMALRINSGALRDERGVPVWHHRLLRGRGVCVDTIGVLVDGRPFALECKRPTWAGVSRGTSDVAIREQEQERFLEHVRDLGGLAGFVRSVDEARAVLEG